MFKINNNITIIHFIQSFRFYYNKASLIKQMKPFITISM